MNDNFEKFKTNLEYNSKVKNKIENIQKEFNLMMVIIFCNLFHF